MAKARAYGKTIRRKQSEAPPQQVVEQSDKRRSEKVLSIAKKRGQLISAIDKVANHSMHHANWFYEKSRILFPDDPEMRFVGRYYPFADNGPLYVDEPKTKWEVERCKEKGKILKEAGMRYFFVDPFLEKGEHHTSMQSAQIEDALNQLGEL